MKRKSFAYGDQGGSFGQGSTHRYRGGNGTAGNHYSAGTENRLLLRRVMTDAGYKPLRSEWWHFNFRSREEAKRNYKVIR